MKRLSSPVEILLKDKSAGDAVLDADYLVIGSGYGGAVAAARLAEHQRGVVVLERGREYGLGDFPYDISDIPSHVRLHREGESGGYGDALFNFYSGDQVDVLVGSGLGGTSLINANVAEEAPAHVFSRPGWPRHFRQHPAPLQEEYQAVRDLLDTTVHPRLAGSGSLSKYREFQRLGRALQDRVEPAEIAVTFGEAGGQPVRNRVGVAQNPCTDCGNCVTGCNVGAKNTLDRNLLPLAKSRGAALYTGATVERLLPAGPDSDYRWSVEFSLTAQPGGSVRKEVYRIRARHVILAAGTLGSTEILLRSQSEELGFSSKLGKRFSTNGDGVIASFGQACEVNGVASAEQKAPASGDRVGPTITGIIRAQTGQQGQITIEEASIPAALSRVFAEMTATGALLQRLANGSLPRFFKQSGIDPLAASRRSARHSQTFLVMGDDGSQGQLSLKSQEDGSQWLDISYEDAGANPALSAANELIGQQDRKPGLGFGQYVPNPLWQLLPPAAGTVMSGEMPQSRVVTVHPIGGCAMADSIEDGVVNAFGQVFRPVRQGAGTYDGLYIFDGAILPTALETNPFLTIAALAWHHTGALLDRQNLRESDRAQVDEAYEAVGAVPDREVVDNPTEFTIQEQLTGSLDALPAIFEERLYAQPDKQRRLLEREGLVVQVEASIEDGDTWLDGPGENPIPATMRLFVNPLSARDVADFVPVGVVRAHGMGDPIVTLEGHFTVFRQDSPGLLSSGIRALQAVWAYHRRRDLRRMRWSTGQGGGCFSTLREGLRSVLVFLNVGRLQGNYRRMIYDFRCADCGLEVYGEKVSGYAMSLERMWPALLGLNLEFREGGRRAATAPVSVNAEQLLDPGLLRAGASRDLPRSLMFTAGAAAFFTRSLITTQFWEFGGADYPASRDQATTPLPLRYDNKLIKPRMEALEAPLCDDRPGMTPLLMTRYPQQDNDRAPPMLLVHGLAQGSQIYWLPTIENLAAYMHRAGYDVWTVDYRLSNRFMGSHVHADWGMDDIARHDIPVALNHVYDSTGMPVHVFAHCVGACTLAMAVLEGYVESARIAGLVSNAIHPWVITSPANRLRARLGQFNREWISNDMLNPVPSEEDGAVENILDRVAYGLARLNELESDDHMQFGGDTHAHGICDRMTFLYGRMWNHKNLNLETHDRFREMFGPAPAEVYRHLYYYSTLRRITDKHGNNRYLDRRKIRRRWNFPTLFIHGQDSRVFNPHSARRSAMRLNSNLREPGQPMAIPISYRIFKDYGHMDVIFGEPAHRDCFPEYLKFFQTPGTAADPIKHRDWETPFAYHPRTGPLLRAAWRDQQKIQLRYSAELRDRMARKATALKVCVNGDDSARCREIAPVYPGRHTPSRVHFVDVSADMGSDTVELEFTCVPDKSTGIRGYPLQLQDTAWLHRLRSGQEGCGRMRFLVGSCRFPGSIIDNERSDDIFAEMSGHIQGEDGAQLLFLIGDQIYADATDQLLEVDSPKSRYTDRYRRAFRRRYSPHFAALVERIPTHFALDDHEIDDNWSGIESPRSATREEQKRIERAIERMEFAVNEAASFQGSARNQVPVMHSASPSPFYYALEAPAECDFPTFVLDTRTERAYRGTNDPGEHALFGDEQFQHLEQWLLSAHRDYPSSPKFIVSGSTITPLSDRFLSDCATWRRQDGWAGYPATLERLLALACREQIQHLVFIGGDAHLSAVSKLEVSAGGAGTVIWQIVGSGLYAPLPFANARAQAVTWGERKPMPLHTGQLDALFTTDFPVTDAYAQFLRINAESGRIQVCGLGSGGDTLGSYTIDLASSSIT